MDKNLCFVSPAGASGNYIALTLTGQQVPNTFSYHDYGTHGIGNNFKNKGLFKFIHYWDDSHKSLLQDDNNLVIQNVVDDKSEFIIINWWEKFWHNANPIDKQFGENWIREQTDIWEHYGQNALVRAILEWVKNLRDSKHIDIRRHKEIFNTFQFSSLYSDYESVRQQFNKYNVSYSAEQYKNWRESQSIIFDSHAEISKKEIASLKKDYQKAIALSNIEPNLSAEQCWQKHKSKLN